MKFSYQIKDKEGKTTVGYLESSSPESALSFLQSKGYFVISLEKEDIPFYKKNIGFGLVSFGDILNFTTQLSILFKSSVPLVESLKTIANMSSNREFKVKILKMAEKVEGGATLSLALSDYPKLFSKFYVNMAKAGEASGRLSENLDALAEHLANEKELNDKIFGAMAYPIFILVVFVGVLFLMAGYIIPQFKSVIAGYGSDTDLPGITKFIFGLSDFLMGYWVWILIGIAMVIFGIWKYAQSKEGKTIVDKALIRLPLVGDLNKKIQVSTMAESLSTLIAAGIPISQALEITAEVVDSSIYRNIVLDTKEKVVKGNPMSFVFSRYPEEIPPLLTQMVIVGEKTGSLETSMQKVVEFYRKEVSKATDTMISMIQPVLLLVLGGMVAVLVIGIYLPIINLSSGQQ